MGLSDSEIKGAIPCGLERSLKMTKIEKRGSAFYLITSEGTETEVHITKDGKALDLRKVPHPENRQWIMLSKFKDTNVVELAPHVERTLTPRTEKSEKPSRTKEENLADYLEGEDKIAYEALVKKAMHNKKLADARRAVEMAEAEVNRLLAEENENTETEEA